MGLTPNQLKIGHLVQKENRIVIVTIDDLIEIAKEEHLEVKKYQPIRLTEKWLLALGFEKKINPITNISSFQHYSGLRVVKDKKTNDFFLNYTFKEVFKEDGIEKSYSPALPYVHTLLDAFYVVKSMGFNFDEESIKLMQESLSE